MEKTKPRILAGFMELDPEDQISMNLMVDIIKGNFERFGFSPLDTVGIELSEILLAKAGGETEKQIYRFNKGDTDLALRFDLTVPLARYIAMRQSFLTFPFKRYQIGKVYRGERPKKGRFREFYQADIDIVCSPNLDIMYDSEICSVIYNIFKQLGVNDFTILISNRKILSGFLEALNEKDKIVEIFRIVDKVKKIGEEGVREELQGLEINGTNIEQIISFIKLNGPKERVFAEIEALNITELEFTKGVCELKSVVNGVELLGVPGDNYKIDFSIARGLDYYTGTIYETMLDDYPEFGSVCSGGRYDDLASHYTDKKFPGVGVSIGVTRLFDAFKKNNLINESGQKTTAKIVIIPIDNKTDLGAGFEFVTLLRANDINSEVFLADVKLKAKLDYANKISVPYIGIIGEDETKNKTVSLKNMKTGEQTTLPIVDAVNYIKHEITSGIKKPFVEMIKK